MELHNVEVVGLHALQALVDASDDVFLGEDMGAALAGGGLRRADLAPAFCGQIELGTAVGEELADELFALAVVDRRVDVVNARIQDGIQDHFGLFRSDISAAGREVVPFV